MMHSTGPARWAEEGRQSALSQKREMVSRQRAGSHRVIDSPELAAQLDMRRWHRRRPFVLLLFLLRNLRGLVLRQALVRRRLWRLDPDDLAEEAQLRAHDGDVAFGRLRRLLQQLFLQLLPTSAWASPVRYIISWLALGMEPTGFEKYRKSL